MADGQSGVGDLSINDGSFQYTDSGLDITGTFTDPNNATINVSWSKYDSNCNATYSGSRSYTASHTGP